MQPYDLVVIGASLGGTLAALTAARSGLRVALSCDTAWIGGQMTAQAIPPDEHPYIETTGASASYLALRNAIRAHYRDNTPLLPAVAADDFFDPGNSTVSHLAHDPRIAHALLRAMVDELPNLTLYLPATPLSASADKGIVHSVTLRTDAGEITLHATYFIDGTDSGDLLPLCGADYVVGAESRAMTGEADAVDAYAPQDIQPVTWAAVLRYSPDEDLPMEKPDMYDFFANYTYPFMEHKLLSWYGPALNQPAGRLFKMFDGDPGDNFPLWSYRRIADPAQFEPGYLDHEATSLNWPQNDYLLANLIDAPDPQEQAYRAQQLTLSLAYWLKREAPRPDGKKGYAGISLDGQYTGTDTGLAQAAYVRESRRIRGLSTITENLVFKGNATAPPHFKDSVALGLYNIDLHATTQTHTLAYWETYPFEVPLSAMIPRDMVNLLPGCKNIATTHLTNGCYRVHPCEWNIGEAAGHIVAHAIATGKTPAQIAGDAGETASLQERLVAAGVSIHWPETVLAQHR